MLRIYFTLLSACFILTSCNNPLQNDPESFIYSINLDKTLTHTITINNNSDLLYNYHVDCNSDTTLEQTDISTSFQCKYPIKGTYTVTISGHFPHMEQKLSYPCDIKDIKQWGHQAWRSMKNMFANCNKLEGFSALDTPDLSLTQDTSGMFTNAKLFNAQLNHWDVSTVTKMRGMFMHATSFNQPLNRWVVNQVTDMSYLFFNTRSFDQNINSWNVEAFTNTEFMYSNSRIQDRHKHQN
jgi:hypothetical protein